MNDEDAALARTVCGMVVIVMLVALAAADWLHDLGIIFPDRA